MATPDGVTPLLRACVGGHTEVVELLLSYAAKTPEAEDVWALLDKETRTGVTPLYAACEAGHTACVALLLKADITEGTRRREAEEEAGEEEEAEDQPQYRSSFLNKSVPQQRHYVDGGILSGGTALCIASSKGFVPIVELLLGANADVNRCPALVYACFSGHAHIAQLLCSHGARRDSFDQYFYLTLRDRGHDELISWLCLTRTWTPLHYLEVLTPERTRALLRDGADPHAKLEVSGQPNVPSPLERADATGASLVPCLDAVRKLVRDAAKPWSQETHELFPGPAREYAVELFWLGQQLALQPRFANLGRAVNDWWAVMMAFAVSPTPCTGPLEGLLSALPLSLPFPPRSAGDPELRDGGVAGGA